MGPLAESCRTRLHDCHFPCDFIYEAVFHEEIVLKKEFRKQARVSDCPVIAQVEGVRGGVLLLLTVFSSFSFIL